MNNTYNSFMFRFRRAQDDDRSTWIISVQNTQTGQQLCFSSLGGLIQFLHAEFGSHEEQEPQEGIQSMELLSVAGKFPRKEVGRYE